MRAIRRHRSDPDDPDAEEAPDKLPGEWSQNTNFGQEE